MASVCGAPSRADPIAARSWCAHDWLSMGLLVSAVALVYAPVLNCAFVSYDDPVFVTENPDLRAGLSWQGLRWSLTGAYTQMLSGADSDSVAHWHPLVWWTLLLDYQLYGLNAWGYHLTNLLWHLGSTLLLFLALRRMTGARWRSFLVAALFAVHPINVQAVAWIAERKGVVSTFFWMLTLWAYARYAEAPGWRRYALVAVSLALGLQAKQMLVTLPCVLLLLDFWPLRRSPVAVVDLDHSESDRPVSCSWGRLVVEKLPLSALAFGFALLVWLQPSGHAHGPATVHPLGRRICNALISYTAYLGQAVLPLNFAVFYPYEVAAPLWQSAAAALLLVALTIALLSWPRRLPYLTVGWLWYVGTLAPVSGVAMQLGGSARADRYAYVPLVGIYLAVSWALAELAQRWHRARQAAALAGATLAGLMIIAWEQVHYWQDSVLLWDHCLAAGGNSVVARVGLAAALLPKSKTDAVEQLHEALRLDPNDPFAHTFLGMAWMNLGDLARAAEHFEKAIRFDPDNRRTRSLHVVHLNLGIICRERGDLAAAATHLRESLRLVSQHALTHQYLGLVLFEQGQLDEAARHLEDALRLAPTSAAHVALGSLRARQGDSIQAHAHYVAALQLAPDDPEAHVRLGLLLLDTGAKADAEAHFQQALQRESDDPALHQQLGKALLERERWADAASHFQRALALAPQFAEAQCQLGVAQLMSERLEEAIASLRKALELRPGLAAGHYELAYALEKAGHGAQAKAEFAAASRLDPDWPAAVRRAAWSLATDPDPRRRSASRALHLAQLVCHATASPAPESLDTLAAALAAAGEFTQALETAKRAAARAHANGQETLATEIDDRVRLYEKGLPFRASAP